MNLSIKDAMLLLHPIVAIVILFPLLGIVVDRAVLVRYRRQEIRDGGDSQITPSVGAEHAHWGKYLAYTVLIIALLGMLRPTFSYILNAEIWQEDPVRVGFIVLIYIGTIATFICLDRSIQRHWRAIFATLTSMGLIVLGFQDGVSRHDAQWFVSHFYYGLGATILMICALAIFPEIYNDRTNRWRNLHIVLNCVALLFFIMQAVTGTKDLLELSLSQ